MPTSNAQYDQWKELEEIVNTHYPFLLDNKLDSHALAHPTSGVQTMIYVDDDREASSIASTLYRCRITVENLVFPSARRLLIWQRHNWHGSPNLQLSETIRTAASDFEADRISHANRSTWRPDWEEYSAYALFVSVFLKFVQNPHLADWLLVPGRNVRNCQPEPQCPCGECGAGWWVFMRAHDQVKRWLRGMVAGHTTCGDHVFKVEYLRFYGEYGVEIFNMIG